MIKRTVDAPPKTPPGYHTARSRRDERIGYIQRHWPNLHPGAVMTEYERIHHVLRLSEQYDKECDERGPYYG